MNSQRKLCTFSKKKQQRPTCLQQFLGASLVKLISNRLLIELWRPTRTLPLKWDRQDCFKTADFGSYFCPLGLSQSSVPSWASQFCNIAYYYTDKKSNIINTNFCAKHNTLKEFSLQFNPTAHCVFSDILGNLIQICEKQPTGLSYLPALLCEEAPTKKGGPAFKNKTFVLDRVFIHVKRSCRSGLYHCESNLHQRLNHIRTLGFLKDFDSAFKTSCQYRSFWVGFADDCKKASWYFPRLPRTHTTYVAMS